MIELAGGIALIIIGSLMILIQFPGIADTLEGLLNRRINVWAWSKTTKIVVTVMGIFFVVFGVFITIEEKSPPEPTPPQPTAVARQATITPAPAVSDVSPICTNVNQAILNSPDALQYLREVFFWWTLTGDLRSDAEGSKTLLSAFYSILSLGELSVDSPGDKMQSWIQYSVDQAIAAGVCATREQCDFLEFDTAGPFEKLDINESFWRLWQHANQLPTDEIKVKTMAATRLVLVALVGEECQQEYIGKWNEQLK